MKYEPFKRGSYPVGVTTIDIEAGDTKVRVEAWYPAAPNHDGEDFNHAFMDKYTVSPGMPTQFQNAVRDARPAGGIFPLIVQSHAAVGHRRDSAPTCTHLASHGYVIASPEFAGDTTADLLHDGAAGAERTRRILPMTANLANRERVVVETLNAILAGALGELTDKIDFDSIGAFGVSLGGWTTLRLLSLEENVKAAFLAVPSYGSRGPFEDTKLQHSMVSLDDWGRAVPVFLLAGERDALIPVEDMHELFESLPEPKRFGILKQASHFHWFEGAEDAYDICRQMWESGALAGADIAALSQNSPPFSELCSNESALETLRVLCLAHMDAHLKSQRAAKAFLEGDLARMLSDRGINFEDGGKGLKKQTA